MLTPQPRSTYGCDAHESSASGALRIIGIVDENAREDVGVE
jgi:hypothetical protein